MIVECPSVVDTNGLIALPGLVDLHPQLREPGREERGDRPTSIAGRRVGRLHKKCAMAEPRPVADTAGVVEQVTGWVNPTDSRTCNRSAGRPSAS